MLDKITHIIQSYWNYLYSSIVDWQAIINPFHTERGNYFYLLIELSLIVWILEIIFPWRKKQAIIRKDFWLDAFYMFFNLFISSLLFYSVLSEFTSIGFKNLMSLIGLPRTDVLDFSTLPVWIQFILFFLINDFIQWCVHNALHRIPFLWRFHKVHHSVEEMGFAAHLRYHFMETFIYKSVQYIFLSWLFNFDLRYAFILHAFTIAIGHFNHANINIKYGFLKYILNNPQMHIWHHAKELPKQFSSGMNFGITLSIWDYLFKTAYIPSDGRDIKLGFPNSESFPKTFIGQFFKSFRKNT